MKWVMLITMLVFGVCIGLFGPSYWLTPFSEWLVVLIFLNFNFVVAMMNGFYESVHAKGKLMPPVKPVIQNENTSVSIEYEYNNDLDGRMLISAPPPPKPDEEFSMFKNFFHIQDGIISLSLRNLTVVSCLAITASLLGMLYITCDILETENCKLWEMPPELPMVSTVIAYPIFDRIFCLLAGYYCFAVHQVNIRCFFKMLHGIGDSCLNDFNLFLGLVAVFALPAVGYFDSYWYGSIHGPVAVVFFSATGIYAFILSSEMSANESKFPADTVELIRVVSVVKWLMAGILGIFAISMALFGSSYWLSPLSEWLVVIMFVNFFCVVSYAHGNFYHTVHPMGTLVPTNAQ